MLISLICCIFPAILEIRSEQFERDWRFQEFDTRLEGESKDTVKPKLQVKDYNHGIYPDRSTLMLNYAVVKLLAILSDASIRLCWGAWELYSMNPSVSFPLGMISARGNLIINGSVLVSPTNEKYLQEWNWKDALTEAAISRFRPIF